MSCRVAHALLATARPDRPGTSRRTSRAISYTTPGPLPGADQAHDAAAGVEGYADQDGAEQQTAHLSRDGRAEQADPTEGDTQDLAQQHHQRSSDQRSLPGACSAIHGHYHRVDGV